MASILKVITFPGNGRRFKMCIHEIQNIVNTSVRYPGPKPGFGGFEGSVIQAIAENLGVEFDYIIPDDDGFGVRLEDGTWTGCPGMMQRNETDAAMAAMLHNYWHNLFAYTTVSYRTEYVRFITKLPDPVTNPDVIIKVFDANLWITILMFTLFIAFVSYWLHGRKYSLSDSCFSRFAELIMQEPVIKIEKIFSQELLCLFWNTSVLFLTLAYTAVILGAMMMPKRPQPLDTDDKLLNAIKAGKYKAATATELRMYLENMRQSPLSKYHQLADIIQERNWILPVNSYTFAPLLENGYAVASAVVSRKLYESSDIEMVISKDFIYMANLCSLLSKSFPLKQKFDKILTRLVEHAIYEKEFEHFIFKFRLEHNLNLVIAKEPIRALNLTDLQSTFILLGIGLGISTIVLLYEILEVKFKNRNERLRFESKERESQ